MAREVLVMWEFMNGFTNGVRSRVMPRRRNGVGTMTAMLIGASVGIAAWEAVRRNNVTDRFSSGDASQLAGRVMENIQN